MAQGLCDGEREHAALAFERVNSATDISGSFAFESIRFSLDREVLNLRN